MALILKILCGFGVAEIASALSLHAGGDREAARARQEGAAAVAVAVRGDRDGAAAPAHAVGARRRSISCSTRAITPRHDTAAIRAELCDEAIRLALAFGRASRRRGAAHARAGGADVPSRGAAAGARRRSRLAGAARGARSGALGSGARSRAAFSISIDRAPAPQLSELHVEAAIASRHCAAPSFAATDWATIEQLYDLLWQMRPTPIVALNRAIAVGQARGPSRGAGGARRDRGARSASTTIRSSRRRVAICCAARVVTSRRARSWSARWRWRATRPRRGSSRPRSPTAAEQSNLTIG